MTDYYNIFRVVSDYPVGGKPSYGLQPNFYYLSREQTKLGNKVFVISKMNGSQPRVEEDNGIEIHRVDSPFNINSYKMLSKLADGKKNALIHTHSTSGFVLSAMKKPLGLPLFAHVHGASRSMRMPQKLRGVPDQSYSNSRMWYFYFRERIFWSSAERTLAVSDALKDDLISRYKIRAEKINVVYNGVDADLFRRKESPALPPDVRSFVEGRKIVLYVGHFGPRKGLVFLIRAMKDIVREIPDACAVCIGGVPSWLGKQDYWSYLRAEIARNGLDGKILLLDRVPNEQLPEYYSRANVFVLPSFYEAFAKVVLEAMACECPPVITNEGGPREAIEEGKSGLLVEYGSAGQLATAVVRVLQDDNKGRQMGIEARKRIIRDFTWRVVAQRVSDAYDQVYNSTL